MLISKFDLYKTEWLDLVFEDRNKAYGAYELRQHYASTLTKVMGITFLGIAVLCGASLVFKSHPHFVEITQVDNSKQFILPPVQKIKKIDPPTAKPLKAQPPAKAQATQKFVDMVVKTDDQAINPPKNVDLKGAIGPIDVKGPASASNVAPETNPGDGQGTASVPDNSIYSTGGLDVMPEPVGGESAWAKFLNKNLRFPPAAQDDGVSGRVFLSFIIEKDGSLSNIAVTRPAGHGFDEEALRVLKLAKAWKPGMQNGQAVRVRYTIPINFQLSE